jgi:Putative peptidoglycan binding domain
MADHESDRGPDYDDWFDEPAPPPERRRRGTWRAPAEEPDDDSWTVPVGREPRRPREPIVIAGRTLTPRQLAIAAVSALVLLFAILAAAGVFSSSPQNTLPPTTPRTISTPTTTPTTPTTTTPAPATPKVRVPTTTLKQGDSGAQVKLLQKALTTLGYQPGTADGSFGPATKQALLAFQTAQGLTADGVAGPKTLAALKQALTAKSG